MKKNLFKNFKTKKQLRAEIERLKAVHERPPIMEIERFEIKELHASCLLHTHCMDEDFAKESAKRNVANKIFEQIVLLIEYREDDCPEGKIIRGKLRVVGKRI